jgi:hypothetical protein
LKECSASVIENIPRGVLESVQSSRLGVSSSAIGSDLESLLENVQPSRLGAYNRA